MTLIALLILCIVSYAVGRYRNGSAFRQLRRSLKERTVDRNHWANRAEEWERLFWEEWNEAEHLAAERN